MRMALDDAKTRREKIEEYNKIKKERIEKEPELAYMSAQMVKGYLHINYGLDGEQEMRNYVVNCRRNVVISNWKSNGSQEMIQKFCDELIPNL